MVGLQGQAAWLGLDSQRDSRTLTSNGHSPLETAAPDQLNPNSSQSVKQQQPQYSLISTALTRSNINGYRTVNIGGPISQLNFNNGRTATDC